MGFRFHKSIKIAPGVKLNIGKKSMGVSVGNKFGGVSYNTKTGAHTRASVPGTGISYTEKIGDTSKAKKSYDSEITNDGPSNSGIPPKCGKNYKIWFKIIRWTFTVIFSAATVGMFPSFASIVFLAAAFMAAPIDTFDAFMREKLHIGSKLKIAAIVALFILGCVTMPKTAKVEAPAASSSISQETEQKETEITTPSAPDPDNTTSNTTPSENLSNTTPDADTPQQAVSTPAAPDSTPAAPDPTPEPEPTPEPAVTIPYEENYHGHVYATPSGERYHYEANCGGDKSEEITWDTVDARHLTPCKKCVLK